MMKDRGSIFYHRLHTLWHILPCRDEASAQAMDERQLWHLYSIRRLEYRHFGLFLSFSYSSTFLNTLSLSSINEYLIPISFSRQTIASTVIGDYSSQSTESTNSTWFKEFQFEKKFKKSYKWRKATYQRLVERRQWFWSSVVVGGVGGRGRRQRKRPNRRGASGNRHRTELVSPAIRDTIEKRKEHINSRHADGVEHHGRACTVVNLVVVIVDSSSWYNRTSTTRLTTHFNRLNVHVADSADRHKSHPNDEE